MDFLHSLGLTHTDLKPENILLTHNNFNSIFDQKLFPEQVRKKGEIFGSGYASDVEEALTTPYMEPVDPQIKLIDFGGSTFRDDYHSRIVNTRHYRSPEVILGCG